MVKPLIIWFNTLKQQVQHFIAYTNVFPKGTSSPVTELSYKCVASKIQRLDFALVLAPWPTHIKSWPLTLPLPPSPQLPSMLLVFYLETN